MISRLLRALNNCRQSKKNSKNISLHCGLKREKEQIHGCKSLGNLATNDRWILSPLNRGNQKEGMEMIK